MTRLTRSGDLKRSKPMRRVSKKKAAYKASEEGKAGSTHMGKVKQLPCCICENFGMVQNSPTEVHHCKSGRFGNLREHDRCTIPLCHSHHNKLRPYTGDEGKLGYHNGQATWEAEYGPDYDYIAGTLDRVDEMWEPV
ncbi:MAG: Ref family recombination enhancement nuclease [Pseudomonadota bacterium]